MYIPPFYNKIKYIINLWIIIYLFCINYFIYYYINYFCYYLFVYFYDLFAYYDCLFDYDYLL